ncbi:hypothetical protein Taro_017914 [Colocasia esculenta]|uniref:Pentatricopeptide repeat-containing protein n=1 Tax=Colocasia esculenta TaxID=4460 RepID=A0A843UPI3_COLES|nr:hypothetical protein [Colocasia esculenta]
MRPAGLREHRRSDGRQVLPRLLRRESPRTCTYVGGSPVGMYASCGRNLGRRRMFDAMPSRNLVTWIAMLGGYAINGGVGDAVQLFDAMQRSGQVRPDAMITFTCLLPACGQAGLTEQGMYYDVLKSGHHGIAPRMENYACVVSLLGRAGKLSRAAGVGERGTRDS